MEDLPQLYSTSGKKTNSESSEGREADYFDNSDILRPSGEDNVIPDFRNFVKTPKILTREGREQLRSLRPNLGGPYGQRRATRLNENPETPKQSIETPPRLQTETILPRQSEKRKPLSKLFGWVSSPDSQFKIATPRDIPSPEFINQTYEVDARDTEYLQLNREEKPNSPFIHFMDDNGVIWNRSDMYNMDPAANSTEMTNLTDTIPLTTHLRQQLVNFPQTTNANGTMTDGAIGGIGFKNRNVIENNMSHAGGSGFSPPLQERVLMNDHTEYRVPANVPVLHDLNVPAMYQTPQTAEMSSIVGDSMSQTGNPFFSPVPQMQLVGHSLPVLPNTMAQQVPQQFIQIPQIGQNISLPVSQHVAQQIPQIGQNISLPVSQHFAQQIPLYVVQNQPAQSPLHQVQQLQQSLQQQPVQNLQQIGTDRGPGAIPRPSNPFYTLTTNHQRFIASTPPTQAQYVQRSPNLSPISLRAPPGFVPPPQEQKSNQVHNTRLNRNMANYTEYDRTLDPLEIQNGRQAPPSNPQGNTLGPFKPIKGAEYLPTSAPGCI